MSEYQYCEFLAVDRLLTADGGGPRLLHASGDHRCPIGERVPQGIELVRDLQDLAARQDRVAEFTGRLAEFHARHGRKHSLMRKLLAADLMRKRSLKETQQRFIRHGL